MPRTHLRLHTVSTPARQDPSSTIRPGMGNRGMLTLALLWTATLFGASPAMAQGTLKSAQPFAVLGGSTVTNTGPTTIKGNLGVSPGSALTDASGGLTVIGSVHLADAVAAQAQVDASKAYMNLAALLSTQDLSGLDLGGMTLTPGVYSFSSSAQLTGNLFLNFLNNPNSLFVFQVGSALTTASGSSVSVLNASTGGGIYWQIGSSATLGAGTAFKGNIIADQSITLVSGATILCGRAIALHGAVTMDNNTISNDCTNGGNFGSGADDGGSLGFGNGDVTTTPEPTSLALLVGPLCIAVCVARRRGRRSPSSAMA